MPCHAVADNVLLHLACISQRPVCAGFARDVFDHRIDDALIAQNVKERIIGFPEFFHIHRHGMGDRFNDRASR